MIKELLRLFRVTKGGTDADHLPVQQVEFMGNAADAFFVFPYGMSANVATDAIGVLLSVNGDEQSLAALATSAIDRIKGLKEGEVIFFHPKKKSFIKFSNSGNIDIEVKEKIAIRNENEELIDLISQMNTAIAAITTNTMFGPTPINNLATFTALQPKIDSFKE